jgi:hypothetical protein
VSDWYDGWTDSTNQIAEGMTAAVGSGLQQLIYLLTYTLPRAIVMIAQAIKDQRATRLEKGDKNQTINL